MLLIEWYIPGFGAAGNRPVTLWPRTKNSNSVSFSSHRVTPLRMIFSMSVNWRLLSVSKLRLMVRFIYDKIRADRQRGFCCFTIYLKRQYRRRWVNRSIGYYRASPHSCGLGRPTLWRIADASIIIPHMVSLPAAIPLYLSKAALRRWRYSLNSSRLLASFPGEISLRTRRLAQHIVERIRLPYSILKCYRASCRPL